LRDLEGARRIAGTGRRNHIAVCGSRIFRSEYRGVPSGFDRPAKRFVADKYAAATPAIGALGRAARARRQA
jgi:hypothetical protein